MSILISNVVYKTRHTPKPYTIGHRKPYPLSDTDIEYIVAQTELHHPDIQALYYIHIKQNDLVSFAIKH